MKRLPSKSTRNAPSPRTASEISGCWPRESGPRYMTVGWNCTNSRSRTVAPARSAIAVPSPVATAGLVVWEKTWPSPPLASTTARQWTAPTPSICPSPITCRVSPATAPSSASSRSTARACSTTSISGAAWTAALRARWISAPVASPPAWAIRSRWWPPSRVRLRSPAESWSKLVPSADQLAHGGRAVGDQDVHGLLVAGPRARHQRVALVLLGGVARTEGGGDAALGPLGRPGVEDVLGDHQDAADLVLEPQRRGEPGDAGADDHDVAGRRPARFGGQQSAGKHVVRLVAGRQLASRSGPVRFGAAGVADAEDERAGCRSGGWCRPWRRRWPGPRCRRAASAGSSARSGSVITK